MTSQTLHIRHNQYGREYYAGKQKKKVVVGGDPHSSKSSFMRLLQMDLKEKGIDVQLFELDAASGDVQRFTTGIRAEKQPWTINLAKKTQRNFIKESQRHDITLGDTPGKITPVLETLTKEADAAIVLAKNDEAKERWTTYFNRKNVPILAVIDTSKFASLQTYNPKYNKGNIALPSREVITKRRKSENIVVESLSYEIAQQFGFTFKSYRTSGYETYD